MQCACNQHSLDSSILMSEEKKIWLKLKKLVH